MNGERKEGALDALRMVERAWCSCGTPAYIDPDSPLARVQKAIASVEGLVKAAEDALSVLDLLRFREDTGDEADKIRAAIASVRGDA